MANYDRIYVATFIIALLLMIGAPFAAYFLTARALHSPTTECEGEDCEALHVTVSYKKPLFTNNTPEDGILYQQTATGCYKINNTINTSKLCEDEFYKNFLTIKCTPQKDLDECFKKRN